MRGANRPPRRTLPFVLYAVMAACSSKTVLRAAKPSSAYRWRFACLVDSGQHGTKSVLDWPVCTSTLVSMEDAEMHLAQVAQLAEAKSRQRDSVSISNSNRNFRIDIRRESGNYGADRILTLVHHGTPILEVGLGDRRSTPWYYARILPEWWNSATDRWGISRTLYGLNIPLHIRRGALVAY